MVNCAVEANLGATAQKQSGLKDPVNWILVNLTNEGCNVLVFHEQSLTEVDLFVVSGLFQFPHSRVILDFDILSLGRRLNLF